MKYLFYLSILLFFSNCETKTKSEVPDSFSAALPHAESLPEAELSQADQQKLSEAKGIVSEQINEVDLLNIKANAKDNLFIFSFWTLDCGACINNLKNLRALEFSSNQIMVLSINLDDISKKDAVNLFIRKHNIPFKSFQMKSMGGSWKSKFDETWKGQMPAIFFVNDAENVNIKYFKELSKNELEAITQALVI